MKRITNILALSVVLLSSIPPPSLVIADTNEASTSIKSNQDNLNIQDRLTSFRSESNTKVSSSWGTASWTFDENNGVLNISSGKLGNSLEAPWNQGIDASRIITIVISPNTQAPEGSASLFSGLKNLVSIEGFQNLDTSLVTNMQGMFRADENLVNIDLTKLNTVSVTNMSSMFSSTFSLTNYDLSSFNTSNVTDMSSMFSSTEAGNLDLSSFDTHNVTNMSSMFEYARLTNINLSSFDTENVSTMNAMFSGNPDLVELNIDNFDTGNVKNMTFMFEGNSSLKNLNLTNFDTNQVTTMRRMFDGCDSLQKLTLGGVFRFISDASLGIPVPLGGKGTGNWIKEDNTSKGYSPTDLMTYYGTNDLTPGAYIAELIEKKIVVKDLTIYVGDAWTAQDNFVSATDSYGNPVDFSQLTIDDSQVDTSKADTYEVSYTYDGVTSTAKVIVKDKQTAVNVHDSTIYVGDTWTAQDNFDSALDKDGNPVDFSQVTVDDSQVDTSKAGTYEATYTYDEVTSTATITVKDKALELIVPDYMDFGTYRLGDENTRLTWSKENKIEVQDTFNLGWHLEVSLQKSNLPDLENHLFYNKQNIDEMGVEISSGIGSSVVSDDFQQDKSVYFDYSNVKELRKDKATLEWTLTPSIKGVVE